jgi:hypothetical protein
METNSGAIGAVLHRQGTILEVLLRSADGRQNGEEGEKEGTPGPK